MDYQLFKFAHRLDGPKVIKQGKHYSLSKLLKFAQNNEHHNDENLLKLYSR